MNKGLADFILFRILIIGWIITGSVGMAQVVTDTTEAIRIPGQYHSVSPFVVNPFESMPPAFGLPGDTLTKPIGILKVDFGVPRQEVTISPDWKTITIRQTVDGNIRQIPFTAPLDWFFYQNMYVNRRVNFVKQVNATVETSPEDESPGASQSLEVVGVDLGGFGRASLRVTGNVNISGKMVFQDQELVHSSYDNAQNTHLEFDQKQNLNIEGKIGDRITVKMDQDSERDFDWENNIRISYKGREDEIIKQIDAGNISLSLPATQYVTFSGKNSGLFGLKAVSQLGPVDFTTIASIEQTKKEKLEYKGDSESKTQSIEDYKYLKHKYFFIHRWFRNGINSEDIPGYPADKPPFQILSYYPLVDGLHQIGNVVVKNFELYRRDQGSNAAAEIGVAYIDPNDPDNESYAADNEDGVYVRLERDVDYTLEENLGYIRMTQPVQNTVIGCHYELVDQNTGDTLWTVGHGLTAADSTLSLLLLTKPSPNPKDPNWDLMFKNVYYLGTTDINPEGFEVRLIQTKQTPRSDRNKQGDAYITLFGLDQVNENGDPIADEVVDIDNPNIVRLRYGELHFPAFHPFVAQDDSTHDGNPNEELYDLLGEGFMYNSSDNNEISGDQHFEIEVDYTNQSSTINLGFMLVEGSEEIKINGVKQTRGTDYQIDYFTGTIVMLNEIDPNADISVLYEKHELVSFDKKVIFGSRAQMDINERSFIGATALYFNQSVINEKVEVGYEPTRNFIWDVNGRYETDFMSITRLLDRLPVIETEKPSTFSVEGEYAQVLPNPNPVNNTATGDPNGVAYIDDFEGAKRTSTPPIQQRFWYESSAPINWETGVPYRQLHRARMYWYNPYAGVRTKDIWPNQSTSLRAQNETTDILILHHERRDHQADLPADSVWSGIMTPFYSGDYDQSNSKFFEIWVNGKKGKLTVDLGKISEDRNGNGELDTEDIPVSGLSLGNGFLEDHEDVGLDGCPDEYEDGWGGCLDPDDSTYQELEDEGETVLINVNDDVDPEDPNYDNWYFDADALPRDYRRVNGTEGNGTGSLKQEGGTYPDTEDLDGESVLDKTNNYFSKSFSLSPDDTTYFAGETVQDDGSPTGWRLIRIPLSHFDKVGDADWTRTEIMRLIWSGVDSVANLQIAKVELVGNEWTELGVAADTSAEYTKDDSVFAIAVINTDDNASYVPPDGVKGEYDRINEIRSKEQSLVLKFTDLLPDYAAAAQKSLMSMRGDKAQSYLTYDRMKMYIYGDSPVMQTTTSEVEIFMRFGLGDDNYYEIRKPVYSGWDQEENRNAIDIDLNWLTRLKLQDSTSIESMKYNPGDEFLDSANVVQYRFTDEQGMYTGKSIKIKGQPALNRIKFFTVGLKNKSPSAITGEVWLDELRLSGVKKDKGVAMRVQTKLDFADIANTSFVYSRKDADFHVLQERLGSNNTQESMRFNANIQLHKLLPRALGLSIPINTSFSNNVRSPKYFPDSDVLVNEASVPDSILTKNQSVSVSTSIARSVKSDHALLRYTLDNLKGSFNASRSISSDKNMREVRNETYGGKLSYNLSFGKENFWTPFSWLEPVPLIGDKISDTQIYYSPASVNTSMNVSEKLTQKTPRTSRRKPDIYNLGLSRNFGLKYKLTQNINANYSRAVKSDLDDYRAYVWMALRDMDPGKVTSTSENLSTNYSPQLIPWFMPSFNYSAGYQWSKNLAQATEGANIGTNLNFNSNVSVSLREIIELFYKPQVSQLPGRSRSRGRQSDTGGNEPGESEEEKSENGPRILKGMHGISKNINPISITYNQSLTRTGNGILGTVPAGYKFGWLPDHELDHSGDVGTNTGNWAYKRDLAVRTGFKPLSRVSINLNYAQNMSMSLSGSGVDKRSFSQDWLAYGGHLEEGLPFAGWSMRISGLEKIPLIDKLVKSASLEHVFSGKRNINWKLEGVDAERTAFFSPQSFIDDYVDYQITAKKNASFSPLAGLSMSLIKGISMNVRYNQSISVSEESSGLNIHKENSWTASSTYNHKGGFTIPLPFMDDFKIQNNMNFSLNFDLNESKDYAARDNNPVTRQNYSSGWKIGTRIQYSFTSKVSGGIVYEYRESDSDRGGKKIDRDFGFDLNLQISG